MKWFKRRGVKYLSELLGDDMNYVIIEYRMNHMCIRIQVWETTSKYDKYHTFVFIIYYKVNLFFQSKKVKVNNVKKQKMFS